MHAYAGASFGKSDIDSSIAIPDLITSGTVDGKDTGFKIYGGLQFNQYFGLEVAYVDLGKATYSGTFFGLPVTGGKVDVSGVNLSAVGTYPLNPSFALFGKLGLFGWNTKASDVTGGLPFSGKDNGTDVSFGLGFGYNFTKSLSARVEWERFKAVEADIDLLSGGIVFKF